MSYEEEIAFGVQQMLDADLQFPQEEPKVMLVKQYIKVPEKPEWISVSDRLPNDTEKVLVYTTTGNTTVARWSQRQEKFVASGHITVTHWMSLPEKPEEEV